MYVRRYIRTYVYTFVCCVQYVCSNMLLSTYATYVHSFIETQKQLYLQIEHFGTKSLYDLQYVHPCVRILKEYKHSF